jgi:hypothetical protein
MRDHPVFIYDPDHLVNLCNTGEIALTGSFSRDLEEATNVGYIFTEEVYAQAWQTWEDI